MKTERKCAFLCVAAALMFLLGLARGIGGLVTIINDEKSLVTLNSTVILTAVMIVGFILLSAATFITAIAIFEHNKKYLLSGVLLTIIFVAIGALNRNLLFDKTSSMGTFINISAAVIIIALLVIGKRFLDKTKRNI
jgi:hypothetical protein